METFDETKMILCYVKGCSNQSRLNKNVTYHKIPEQDRKDIRDAIVSSPPKIGGGGRGGGFLFLKFGQRGGS